MSSSQSHLLKGSLYALSAFFFMALFGMITKEAASSGSSLWISFITYATGAMTLFIQVQHKGLDSLKTEFFPFHLSRAVFGVTATFLYMLSMINTSILNATLLFHTTPIFVPIIATFWLGVSISRRTWVAVVLGLIGTATILFSGSESLVQWKDLIGLSSGISLAIAYIMIKLLTPTDSDWHIIFYFFFLSTIIQLPLLPFAGPLPGWHHCFLALAAGWSLLTAQILLIQAYQFAPFSKVGIFQYSTIVFIGIMDWWMQGIIPPLSAYLGVFIIGSAGLIIFRKRHSAKAAEV